MQVELSKSPGHPFHPLPIGAIAQPATWPNYTALALPSVEQLISLALNVGLCLEPAPASSLPVHAWRALGQLGVTTAIAPLVSLLSLPAIAPVHQELPYVFSYFGPAAVADLAAVLINARQPLVGRLTACHALSLVGRNHFAATHDCVTHLSAQLGKALVNPTRLNAALVEGLIELAAIEAVPVLRRAFSNRRVDTSVTGNWLSVQARLGLISYSQWQEQKKGAELSAPF
ncbi:MAG: hypothetical protein F6K04_06930 [Leptolyngbya sp. SIO4C5]|nr:hypothetical protein [Leptolyngbya sp. SIO4C5]